MKKRLLIVGLWILMFASVGNAIRSTRKYIEMRKRYAEAEAQEAPVLRAYDADGNEIPVHEVSDEEVEEMMNTPTIALSSEDMLYFLATEESFMDYASSSTADFRNESAKVARGAKSVGEEEYELFDEPYLEGPPINMEHFADMVDYYKDRGESVALLIYYSWDPFRGEAYARKFEAYASAFERADVLQYWGDSREASDWGNDDAKTTLGATLEMVPSGQYDHLLITADTDGLEDTEGLAQEIVPRDDFGEVIILTYDAASLRSCPESATVLTEKLGRVPILRPLMVWED